MSTKIKFRQDRRVSQADETSNDSYNNHHIDVTSSISSDYYTEWTTGKNLNEIPNSERIGGLAELPSDKGFKRRNLTKKYRAINGNTETNSSTSFNEIYNRAELTRYP